jgi:hypothetical protein
MNQNVSAKIGALIFSLAILGFGYVALGAVPTFLFAFGFIGGWIAWVSVPSRGVWRDIRWPFFVSLALFVVHRIEERVTGFFPALSDLTDVPTPAISSPAVIGLVLCSVGAWLFIPYTMSKDQPIGRYLAWTFFVSMGVTELAHFAFPLFSGSGYGYYPGMASVVLLAPAAWWGMRRLAFGQR